MTHFAAVQRNMTAAAQNFCAVSSRVKETTLIIMGAAIAASIFALRIILPVGNTENSRETTSGFAGAAA